MAALSTQMYKFKKVLTGCQGEVDLSFGQVTFHSHLPSGKGPRQSRLPTTSSKGQAQFDSYLSEGQAGIQFFLMPCKLVLVSKDVK